MILNLKEEIEKVSKRLKSPEEMLGKGLNQPFADTNSGSRKNMAGTQLEQRLPLMKPEIAIIQTGHENEFGVYSSSYITLDKKYRVMAKISKFSNKPDQDYYLILANDEERLLRVVHRVSYVHITESYGYLLNNDELDRIVVSSEVNEGQCIRKSTAFDEYNNRMDGINLTTGFLNCEYTMEDGIMLSEEAAGKCASPLLKEVYVQLNDNDILLNLYGDYDNYKTFPDIGENIKDGLLCALRRDEKAKSLYMQAYDKLSDIFISDEKYTVKGTIIDIDVYCNDPSTLERFQNVQVKTYYEESMRFNKELLDYVNNPDLELFGYTKDYELQKLLFNSKKILEGGQYVNERIFSGSLLRIMVLLENKMCVGDKMANRYGGKGVVSIILPKDKMPVDDLGRHMDIICNPSGVYNRENPGQLFELSLNHISDRITEYLSMGVLDIEQCVDVVEKYFRILSPKLADYFIKTVNSFENDDEFIGRFLDSLAIDNDIYLSLEPISESMTLNKLLAIHDEFPWIKGNDMIMPLEDSNGNIRYVPGRRPITSAKIYYYRLKQYAEEKFSVTSFSSTNSKNENSRNKANRNYKSMVTRTPIRFGEMETGDLGHVGMELVIVNLMLYSTSPHGRRLAQELYYGNPFDIDIKLDMGAKNRSVEIVQTYLKTMGYRLVFRKVPKKLINPITISPIMMKPKPIKEVFPIFKVMNDMEKNPYETYDKYIELLKSDLINPIDINPIYIKEKHHDNKE